MGNRVRRFLNDESGATAIEYGLIAGLVTLAIVAALGVLGGNVQSMFNYISNAVSPIWQNAGSQ